MGKKKSHTRVFLRLPPGSAAQPQEFTAYDFFPFVGALLMRNDFPRVMMIGEVELTYRKLSDNDDHIHDCVEGRIGKEVVLRLVVSDTYNETVRYLPGPWVKPFIDACADELGIPTAPGSTAIGPQDLSETDSELSDDDFVMLQIIALTGEDVARHGEKGPWSYSTFSADNLTTAQCAICADDTLTDYPDILAQKPGVPLCVFQVTQHTPNGDQLVFFAELYNDECVEVRVFERGDWEETLKSLTGSSVQHGERP